MIVLLIVTIIVLAETGANFDGTNAGQSSSRMIFGNNC